MEIIRSRKSSTNEMRILVPGREAIYCHKCQRMRYNFMFELFSVGDYVKSCRNDMICKKHIFG